MRIKNYRGTWGGRRGSNSQLSAWEAEFSILSFQHLLNAAENCTCMRCLPCMQLPDLRVVWGTACRAGFIVHDQISTALWRIGRQRCHFHGDPASLLLNRYRSKFGIKVSGFFQRTLSSARNGNLSSKRAGTLGRVEIHLTSQLAPCTSCSLLCPWRFEWRNPP